MNHLQRDSGLECGNPRSLGAGEGEKLSSSFPPPWLSGHWAQFRGDSRLQDPPRRYQKRPCALWDPASARSYRVGTRPEAPQPPPAPAQVCCRRENLGPSTTGPRCSASKSKPFTTSSKLRPPATPSIKTASQHLVRDRALSPACLLCSCPRAHPTRLPRRPRKPTVV